MTDDTAPAEQRNLATDASNRIQRGSRQFLSLKEAALACAGLVALAALSYASHIRHGGFYLDDWSDAAGTFYQTSGPGLSHVLSYFGDLFPYRPMLILYVPLKYFVLGPDMALQLAWAVGLAVIVATLVYGILRLFGAPWYHAWLIAALTIVYPLFDSVRLWEAASLPSVAIVFALSGLWIALLGMSRRSWPLHFCAAGLYIVSILTYEITLPLIVGFGALYVIRYGWRVARSRWGVDLAAVTVAGLWNGLHTNREVSGVSGDLHHLGEIVSGGATIVGRTFVPVGAHSHTPLVLVPVAILLAAGLAVYLLAPARPGSESEWGLGSWLKLAAIGAGIAVLGWVMFIPADPYYTPSTYGFTNRVNAVSGFGLVMAAYAVVGVGVALAGRVLPAAQRWTAAITVGLGLLLGAAYIHTLERHSEIWDTAFRAEQTAIDSLRSTYPTLPHETTVFTSGYPAYQTLGVPIFSATWDLNGMIKLEYKDRTLSAFPITAGLELACRPGGVALHGPGASPAMAPYGRARLLNLATGAHAAPQSRRECLRLAGRYVAGPLYLMYDY